MKKIWKKLKKFEKNLKKNDNNLWRSDVQIKARNGRTEFHSGGQGHQSGQLDGIFAQVDSVQSRSRSQRFGQRNDGATRQIVGLQSQIVQTSIVLQAAGDHVHQSLVAQFVAAQVQGSHTLVPCLLEGRLGYVRLIDWQLSKFEKNLKKKFEKNLKKIWKK